jgi:hypothetical protein
MSGKTYRAKVSNLAGKNVGVASNKGKKVTNLRLAGLHYKVLVIKGQVPKKLITTEVASPKAFGQKISGRMSGRIKGESGSVAFRAKRFKGRSSLASYLLDADKPVAERLRLIGAEPGAPLEDSEVRRVMNAIADTTEEVIGSPEVTRDLLASTNFDGTGLTAEQLVREGRSVRVLSRIDDLRFGARD